MKNAMQLKAVIKNIAKEKHISAQLVMQNFMLERLLERISVSKYQQNFILKGGFLKDVNIAVLERNNFMANILIVEDEKNMQDIIAEYIKNAWRFGRRDC